MGDRYNWGYSGERGLGSAYRGRFNSRVQGRGRGRGRGFDETKLASIDRVYRRPNPGSYASEGRRANPDTLRGPTVSQRGRPSSKYLEQDEREPYKLYTKSYEYGRDHRDDYQFNNRNDFSGGLPAHTREKPPPSFPVRGRAYDVENSDRVFQRGVLTKDFCSRSLHDLRHDNIYHDRNIVIDYNHDRQGSALNDRNWSYYERNELLYEGDKLSYESDEIRCEKNELHEGCEIRYDKEVPDYEREVIGHEMEIPHYERKVAQYDDSSKTEANNYEYEGFKEYKREHFEEQYRKEQQSQSRYKDVLLEHLNVEKRQEDPINMEEVNELVGNDMLKKLLERVSTLENEKSVIEKRIANINMSRNDKEIRENKIKYSEREHSNKKIYDEERDHTHREQNETNREYKDKRGEYLRSDYEDDKYRDRINTVASRERSRDEEDDIYFFDNIDYDGRRKSSSYNDSRDFDYPRKYTKDKSKRDLISDHKTSSKSEINHRKTRRSRSKSRERDPRKQITERGSRSSIEAMLLEAADAAVKKEPEFLSTRADIPFQRPVFHKPPVSMSPRVVDLSGSQLQYIPPGITPNGPVVKLFPTGSLPIAPPVHILPTPLPQVALNHIPENAPQDIIETNPVTSLESQNRSESSTKEKRVSRKHVRERSLNYKSSSKTTSDSSRKESSDTFKIFSPVERMIHDAKKDSTKTNLNLRRSSGSSESTKFHKPLGSQSDITYEKVYTREYFLPRESSNYRVLTRTREKSFDHGKSYEVEKTTGTAKVKEPESKNLADPGKQSSSNEEIYYADHKYRKRREHKRKAWYDLKCRHYQKKRDNKLKSYNKARSKSKTSRQTEQLRKEYRKAQNEYSEVLRQRKREFLASCSDNALCELVLGDVVDKVVKCVAKPRSMNMLKFINTRYKLNLVEIEGELTQGTIITDPGIGKTEETFDSDVDNDIEVIDDKTDLNNKPSESVLSREIATGQDSIEDDECKAENDEQDDDTDSGDDIEEIDKPNNEMKEINITQNSVQVEENKDIKLDSNSESDEHEVDIMITSEQAKEASEVIEIVETSADESEAELNDSVNDSSSEKSRERSDLDENEHNVIEINRRESLDNIPSDDCKKPVDVSDMENANPVEIPDSEEE